MIDIICRRIPDEMPGPFLATIHDPILAILDRLDEVGAVMQTGVPAVRAQANEQDGGLLKRRASSDARCGVPAGRVGDQSHFARERRRTHRG
jgi:hypothetical protein